MDSTTVIVTQIVTLITVILGFIVALYRESRNRKWDLEDRQRARAEMMERQNKLESDSIERHKHMPQRFAEIIQERIDRGELVATPEILKLVDKLDATPEKVDEINHKVDTAIEVATDTNTKVTDLKKKVEYESSADKSNRERRFTDRKQIDSGRGKRND